MPRRKNGGLRRRTGRDLEQMTDAELLAVYFTSTVNSDPDTIVFTATPEEVVEAERILKSRGRLVRRHPHGPPGSA